MRYVGKGEALLPWLRAQARDAEHLLMSGPMTADGLDLLAEELEALLHRGGSIVARGGEESALLLGLSDSNPGRVLLPRLSAGAGLRVGVRRRDGHAVAFVGSGGISAPGLSGESDGVLLDGRRDATVALLVMQEMTLPDDSAPEPTGVPSATQWPPPSDGGRGGLSVLLEVHAVPGESPAVRVVIDGSPDSPLTATGGAV